MKTEIRFFLLKKSWKISTEIWKFSKSCSGFCNIEKKNDLDLYFQSEWDCRLCEIKLHRYYEKYSGSQNVLEFLKICCRRKFLTEICHSAVFDHLKTKNDVILRQKFLSATKIIYFKSLRSEDVFCTSIWIIHWIWDCCASF